MTGKWAKIGAFLCVLGVLLGALRLSPAAMISGSQTPPQETADPAGDSHRVTLDAQRVGDGEGLAFETVAAELAGNPFAQGYYPGALTVELTGQLVVESGGCLTIGTLSAGNDKEQSPVIAGELTQDGLIVVRPGGRLILKTVSLDLSGQGLFLVQEPGGSVELTDTAIGQDLVRWAGPTVDNTYQKPLELWLEAGTVLEPELLPQSVRSILQDQGSTTFATLPVRWDLEDWNEVPDGEAVLAGAFLDDSGQVLPSVRPLELTVHWVKPDTLVITDAAWLGQSAASAKLYLKALPDEASEVWGEVSDDEEKSWQQWEGFELRQSEDTVAGVFSLPNAVPRHFRIRAASEDGRRYWMSDSVRLPKTVTRPSDQGGNRGGATTVGRPVRTPEPTPTPSAEPTPTPTPTPTPSPSVAPSIPPSVPPSVEPSAAPSVEPSIVPSPEPSVEPSPSTIPVVVPVEPTATPVPAPTPTAEPTPTSAPSAEPSPAATPTPSVEPSSTAAPPAEPPDPPVSTAEPLPAQEPEGLPPTVQALLVLAGGGLCALAGVLVTKRKR